MDLIPILAGLLLLSGTTNNNPIPQYIPGNQEIILRSVNITNHNLTDVNCIRFITGNSLCDTQSFNYDIKTNESYLNATIDNRVNITAYDIKTNESYINYWENESIFLKNNDSWPTVNVQDTLLVSTVLSLNFTLEHCEGILSYCSEQINKSNCENAPSSCTGDIGSDDCHIADGDEAFCTDCSDLNGSCSWNDGPETCDNIDTLNCWELCSESDCGRSGGCLWEHCYWIENTSIYTASGEGKIGVNVIPRNAVSLDLVSGDKGGMGFPYETAVFERSGDNKVTIADSSLTPGYEGMDLIFTYTGKKVPSGDFEGYYPGIGFQVLDAGGVWGSPESTYMRYNYVGRNEDGSVVASHINIIQVWGDGHTYFERVGIGTEGSPSYALDIEGDVNVNGKITASGGVDPPYLLIDKNTQEEFLKRVKMEIPPVKQDGLVLWYNGSSLLGYVPKTGDLYEVYMKKIGNIKMPSLSVDVKNSYYVDSMSGEIVKTESLIADDAYKLENGYILDKLSGQIIKQASYTEPEYPVNDKTAIRKISDMPINLK